MKMFKSKIILMFTLLFSFFINSSKTMSLVDFNFKEFDEFNRFLKTDCNFEFFIKTLEQGREFLTESLFEKNESNWFSDYDYFDYYAQRSVEEKCNVIVIGDLHGNYKALYQIIQNLIDRNILSKDLKIKAGYKIVSLGDYIDRGSYSPQVLSFLIILKLINPEDYIMLRGNHETEAVVDSIIPHLNSVDKQSIEYLKHYDFIANILIQFSKEGKNTIALKDMAYVSEDMEDYFIFIKNLFIDFFSLLPTVFYLQVSDKTFMFNHAGYAEDYLFENQLLPQFLSSDFKYALLELEDSVENIIRKSLLFGDIFPKDIFEENYFKSSDKNLIDKRIKDVKDELNLLSDYLDPDFPDEYLTSSVSKKDLQVKHQTLKKTLLALTTINFLKGSRGGFTFLDTYVSELMKKSNITAKFFGHTHNLIKRVYKNDQDYSVYKDYHDGFMRMGTRDNPIFNLISAKIYSQPMEMNYNTSYLELIIDDNEWDIIGNSLTQGDNIFKSKLVPYCYDL